MKKKKILIICDDPLRTSGVGCQAKHLIDGLVKQGDWTVRVLGGAIRHENYDVVTVNPDFIVKPVDGFGNPDILRNMLAVEKPDVLLLFTDPRFFIWVWEMEDEIHQFCPIAYWHVWDNDPYPAYNDVLYKSTDLINCHSYLTYTLLHDVYPEKVNFIPHAVPENIFFPIDKTIALTHRDRIIEQQRHDHFVCIWVNRNARRKMPGNVMLAWSIFLQKLEEKFGHRKATLLMHTHPYDPEGQNLPVIADHLKISDNVIYSSARLSFDDMNILYNIADCAINISSHEGFGMGTLEAMQCGLPIIALKTGGLTRQVVDHRDDSVNGVALDPDVRDFVGGQTVPYIYEDHVSVEKVADAYMQLYELSDEKRNQLGQKARSYVLSEFNSTKTVADWHQTLNQLVSTWKNNKSTIYNSWEITIL